MATEQLAAGEDIHAQSAQTDDPHPSPVPVTGNVRVDGIVSATTAAADYGSYRTVALTGSEDKQQALSEDSARTQAWLIATGTGPVYFGSEAQCAMVRAGNTVGANPLPIGIPVPIGHKQAVWIVPDGSHSATVLIINERRQMP